MSVSNGAARNGQFCEVDFPFFAGVVEVRQVGDGLQAAYFGAGAKAHVEGTVNGVAHRVVEASDKRTSREVVQLTLMPVCW